MDLNLRVMNIKGNAEEKSMLIEQYKPYIALCVERFTKRYVNYGHDDELSIGLIAFDEAIEGYDISRGSFLAFASGVIKRRLIDYVRKEGRQVNVISFSAVSEDKEGKPIDITYNESIRLHAANEESRMRKLEIEEFVDVLKQWGISLEDLADVSPKQEKTRLLYKQIVQYIINNPEVFQELISKKLLPIIEIQKGMEIPRKKIERARKYIISMVIMITGDFKYIQSYIDWP
jgi:RNA polymerase sigma factor